MIKLHTTKKTVPTRSLWVVNDSSDRRNLKKQKDKNKKEENDINHFPALPEGVDVGSSILAFRTYLSDPISEPAGGIPLPQITFEHKGLFGQFKVDEMTSCQEHITDGNASQIRVLNETYPTPIDPVHRWFKTVGVMTPFPNEDIAYLATTMIAIQDYGVVVRAKAPTYATGSIFNNTTPNPQVRFWSICKFSLPSTNTDACLADYQIPLNSVGNYTIVISPTEPNQPSTPGQFFSWLPHGPTLVGVIALRNMIPSEDFYEMSVQNVDTLTLDSARENMGPYYPEARYCPLATIESNIDDCF